MTETIPSQSTTPAAPVDPVRKTVLLTGATGFLGGALLKRILDRDDTTVVICPVRAASADNAQERGVARLADLYGTEAPATARGRVLWVRADLEELDMGWDTATWRQVASLVTEIFHCAASVTFDLPLAEAHRINVDGTKHVFALAEAAQAAHGRFVRFHHVSTAYVAGTVKRRVDANFLPPDRAGAFRNTYERTKARAERWLRTRPQAGPRSIPVSIYRPSIVAGDTVTGVTDNWNVLYVPMKMVARGVLPTFPIGGKALVDSVGVDYVVDAMLAFASHATGSLHAYHLTAGPSAFTVADLIGTTTRKAQRFGGFKPSETNLVGPARWKSLSAAMRVAAKAPKWAGNLRRTGRLATRGLDKCGVYAAYTQVSVVFDTTREHDILRWYGVQMPSGLRYLNTVIDYALRSDFGRNVAAVDSASVTSLDEMAGASS